MARVKTLPWWYRASAKKALESWIRPLITPRPYTARYDVGAGSYMDFSTREIIVDPTAWDFMKIAAHLPIIWNGTWIDTEAKLQWRYARTGARHEAMHVLFSVPPECSGTLHFLVNSLEDEWMEQVARFYYPAAWGDFVAKSRLITKYYPIPDPEESDCRMRILNMCLYHRWDWKRAKGTPSRYRFRTKEDEQCWLSEIRPLVEKAWRTNEDAGRKEIAREILRILALPESAPLPASSMLFPTDWIENEGERGERGEDDAPLPYAVAGGKASEGENGENPEASGVSARGAGVGDALEPPYAALVTLVSEEDEVPSPLTAADELYLLPPQYLEQQVRGEKNRLLRVLLAKTPDAGEDTSSAGGEFDTEAYLRSDGARPFRLHDDDAPDHAGLAIALVIDTTGSMAGWGAGGGLDSRGVFLPDFYSVHHRMTYARQVAMLFELVCPPAGIQLLIGAAGDSGLLIHLSTDTSWHDAPMRAKPGQPVNWLRTRETPRDSEVTRAAIAGLYGRYRCERISASLREAQRELAPCTAGTKLIMYVHDGEPTDEYPSTIVSLLKEIRRTGTLVVAPYVGMQSGIRELEAIFGTQWTLPIEHLSDLSRRLGRLLLKYARH